MSETTYRTVHLNIATQMRNMDTRISDDEVIDILHKQLNNVFGLYIDRNQITIKGEGE